MSLSTNQIYHGDALELLEEVEEGSINAVLTDPPYNISSDFTISRGSDWDGNTISHDFGEWDHDEILPVEWVPQTTDKLEDNGVFISMYDSLNMHHVIEPLKKKELEIRQKIYWHKANPPPQGFGVKWQSAVEEAVVATVNEGQGHHYQKEEGQRHNVIETPLCMGHERYEHPTQKPEDFFRPIIRWWTEPGDTILDPFCGTGTVCSVAKEMDREFIGFEQDEEWTTIAQERIGQDVDIEERNAMEW